MAGEWQQKEVFVVVIDAVIQVTLSACLCDSVLVFIQVGVMIEKSFFFFFFFFWSLVYQP